MIALLQTARICLFLITVTTFLSVTLGAKSLGADSRPNIILFLADDMGPGDTSAYQDWTGNSDGEQIKTPVMERLAASGVRFIDAHSPAAVCNPTRISLLRGGRPVDRPQHFGVSLPTVLKRAGYRTYGVGKWHVFFESGGDYHYETPIKLGPIDFGFDHYTGTQHNIAHSPAFIVDRSYHRFDETSGTLVPNRSSTPPGYSRPGGPYEGICTQIWLDAAREYLGKHAPSGAQADKPFFLYYPSHANHNHCYSPETLDGIPIVGACKTADGRLLKTNRNDLKVARSEMVYENDVALSLLLQWLEKTDDPRNSGQKMIANTLIIFTSDNGANVDPGAPGVGPMSGHKGMIEEGGHRVPFIASWPARIPKGKTSTLPVSLLDLYATFASIADEQLSDDEGPDSCDMSAALLDPDYNQRDFGPFVAQKLYPDNCSIRAGDYKISWLTKNTEFHSLYDVVNDIGEQQNLLGLPEFEQLEARLKNEANAFLKRGKLPVKGAGRGRFDGRAHAGPEVAPVGGPNIRVARRENSKTSLPASNNKRDKRVHLFLCSGQSNMKNLDLAVSFTPTLKKAFPNDEIIVVKAAYGGRPIARWVPRAKIYQELLEKAKVATKGKDVDTISFIWMQGERDHQEDETTAAYKTNLEALYKQLYEDLGRNDIRWVIGRISDARVGTPNWDRIREIQVEVADSRPLASWIDTDDLNGPSNGVHCPPNGYKKMGTRFATAAIELLQQGQ